MHTLQWSAPFLESAGGVAEFALNWVIQSTLLLSIGLLVGWLLRRRGSAVQSAVYRTTLAAVLASPLATWLLAAAGASGWSIELADAWHLVETQTALEADTAIDSVDELHNVPSEAASPAPPPVAFDVDMPDRTSSWPVAPAFGEPPLVLENQIESFEASLQPSPKAALPAEEVTREARQQTFVISRVGWWSAAACLLWLLVSSVLLVRIATAWRQLIYLCRQASPVDEQTLDLLRTLAAQCRVAAPNVRYSPLLPSPCLAGLRRPSVLLPEEPLSLPLRDVLIHELAHLKRHDCHWNLFRQLAFALFFFQPLLWRLSRRIEATAEEVCDDYVVQFGGDRRDYAHRLVDIAELSLAPVARAGVGIVSIRSLLGRRVARILDTSRNLSTRVGQVLLAAVLVVGLLGTLLAGLVGVGASARVAETQSASTTDTEQTEDLAAKKDADDDLDDDLITVRGRVLDPDGNAVAEADVYVLRWYWNFGDRKPLARARTDDEGKFKVSYRKSQYRETGSRPEQWREADIAAFADGYGPGWVVYKDLKPGEEATIRLVPDDVPIEGRIVDIEGKPIAGTRIGVGALYDSPAEGLGPWIEAVQVGQSVAASHSKLGGGLPAFVAEKWTGITTDDEGRFRVTGLGRERVVNLHVSGPNIVTATVRVVTRRMDPISQPEYDHRGTHSTTNYGARFEFAAAPSRVIEGVVRDAETGEPLAGIRIWSDKFAGTSLNGIHSIKTTTDENGRYRLEGMPKGEGNEIVVLPGDDLPYFMRDLVVPGPPGIEPVSFDIEMHRGVWAAGRVTNKLTREPVAARMYYIPFPDNRYADATPEFVSGYHLMVQDRYRTRADGTYRLVALPGRGVVGVQSLSEAYPAGQGYDEIKGIKGGALNPFAKFATAVKEIRVSEDDDEVVCDFDLDPGRRVTLRTVDSDGAPLVGVLVSGLRETHGGALRMETDRFDLLAFRDDEKRSVLLHHKERDLGKALRVSVADGDAGAITVRLEACAKVSGRLVDGDGEPVRGASINIWVADDGDYGRRLSGAATDNEGRFHHEGFLPGVAYSIGAQGADIAFATVARKLAVEPGETIDLGTIDITSDERPEPVRTSAHTDNASNKANEDSETNEVFTVRGRVVDPDGNPVADATVRLPDDLSANVRTTHTDDAGRFQIAFDKSRFNEPAWHAQPWRRAFLYATADGFAPQWVTGNELDSDPNPTLQLQRDDVPIHGQVLNLEGQPVPQAKLEIWDIYDSHSGNLDGLLDTLRDSPRQVQTYMNRNMRWFRGRLLELQLERGTADRLENGNPIITTDDQGRFEFLGVGPERLARVQVRGSNVQTVHFNVLTRSEIDDQWKRTGINDKARMMLDTGSALPQVYAATFKHFAGPSFPITGTVRDRDTGEPIEGIGVAGWLRNTDNHAHAFTDEHGRYELTGLAVEGTFQQLGAGPKDSAQLPYIGAEKPKITFSAASPPTEEDTNFQLTRGIVVRGKVTDAVTGEPVKARIEYLAYGDNPHVDKLADDVWGYASATTDDDGEFAMAVLPGPGTLAVWTRLSRDVPDRYRPATPEEFGVPVDERGWINTANRGSIRAEHYKAARFIDFGPGEEPPKLALSVNPVTDITRVRCVDQQGKLVRDVGVAGHLPQNDNFRTMGHGGLEIGRGAEVYIEIADLSAESRRPVVFRHREKNVGAILYPSRSESEPRLAHLPRDEDGVYRITLAPCGTITGQLVHTNGDPVTDGGVGLVLLAGSVPHVSGEELPVAAMRESGIEIAKIPVDEQGRFQLQNIPAGGAYWLLGGGDAFRGGILKRDLQVSPGEAIDLGTIDVTSAEPPEPVLTAAGSATDSQATGSQEQPLQYAGRVVTPDGKPAAGVDIHFVVDNVAAFPPDKPVTKTKSDGSFEFRIKRDRVPADRLSWSQIVAVANGFGSDGAMAMSFEVSGQFADELADLAPRQKQLLPRERTLRLVVDDVPVRGRIVDLEGQPVAGATVRVLQIRMSPDNNLNAFAEALPSAREARALENQMLPKTIRLSLPEHFIPPLTTDDNGQFTLHGIGRERLVTLRIDGAGMESQVINVLTRSYGRSEIPDYVGTPSWTSVYHGAKFDHPVAPAKSVVGVVRDKESGKPLAGVTLRGEPSLHGSSFVQSVEATTDAEGTFKLVGLPQGSDRRILAIPPDDEPYLLSSLDVPQTAGLDAVTVDFELKRGNLD